MADIKYTPSELLAQSDQMTALQSEFDALFKQTTTALNGMNESWSENIARNFSGKIQSAQKSFSGILNMLSNGSAAARLGATSHSPTAIESFLGSLNQLDEKIASAAKPQEYISYLTDEDKQKLYDMLPPEAKSVIKSQQDGYRWLAENYKSLPEAIRGPIEKMLPSVVKDTISVYGDVVSGETDLSKVGKGSKSLTVNTIMGTLQATFNKKTVKYDQAYNQALTKAVDAFHSGDVGKGLQHSVECLSYEFQKAGYIFGDSITNIIGATLESKNIPVIRGTGSWLHNIL